MAKRAEGERDVSSGSKNPERIDGNNGADAEGGERVSEAEAGVRVV